MHARMQSSSSLLLSLFLTSSHPEENRMRDTGASQSLHKARLHSLAHRRLHRRLGSSCWDVQRQAEQGKENQLIHFPLKKEEFLKPSPCSWDRLFRYEDEQYQQKERKMRDCEYERRERFREEFVGKPRQKNRGHQRYTSEGYMMERNRRKKERHDYSSCAKRERRQQQLSKVHLSSPSLALSISFKVEDIQRLPFFGSPSIYLVCLSVYLWLIYLESIYFLRSTYL